VTSRAADLTLVVLAAGLGTRFGGAKQLEVVGPDGSTLMDYTAFDAVQAGFTRLVFVLRPELGEGFERDLAPRLRSRAEVVKVFQRNDAIPPPFRDLLPPRMKPWGTAHAVLSAAAAVRGSFAVLNADDLYGRSALDSVAGFLSTAPPAAEWAVVGYRLERTTSPHGGVSRAELVCDRSGTLHRIREVRGLAADGSGWFTGEAVNGPVRLPAGTLVSMNLWGFTPALLPALEAAFHRFLSSGPSPAGELYLPEVVSAELAAGRALVRVLPTDADWCGMTHPDDLALVKARVAELVQAGRYPETLWP
jgi:NDP-sugar pyrophosphorylase family protein